MGGLEQFIPLLSAASEYAEMPGLELEAAAGAAQTTMIIMGVVYGFIAIFVIAGVWKSFSKAGEPGWASIVPIYNMIIMAKLGGRTVLWGILPMLPIVGIVFGIIVTIDFAKAFGKGAGFAVGMVFLPFIFWPILGFGGAQYQGQKGF